jgi:hypothetical protein
MQLTVTPHEDGAVRYRFDRTDGEHDYPTVNVTYRPADHFPNKGFDRMHATGPCLDERDAAVQSYVLDPTNGLSADVVVNVRANDTERIQNIATGAAIMIFNS